MNTSQSPTRSKLVLLNFTVMAIASIASGSISAQPLAVNLTSVEWMAADNHQIVVGSIISQREIPNSSFSEITIDVGETLKGERFKQIKFVHQDGFGAHSVDDLIETKQQFVFFFSYWFEATNYRSTDRYFARHDYFLKNAILLEPKTIRTTEESVAPVVTSDLRELNRTRK